MRDLFLLLLCLMVFADDYSLTVDDDPSPGSIEVNPKSYDTHRKLKYGEVRVGGDSTITYNSTIDINEVVVDSFSAVATDDANNVSYAKNMYIIVLPKQELEVFAVNNPLSIIGNNVKTWNGSNNFDLHSYENGNGIIFIINTEINVTNGKIAIFDPVGNLITNEIILESSAQKGLTFIGSWDGKNRNGRYVSAGSYIVYIEINGYDTDYNLPEGFSSYDIPDFNKDVITTHKVIGIKKSH